MELVYESKFVEMLVDKEQSLLIDTWKEETRRMTEQEFRDELIVWKDIMIERNLRYDISDTINFHFTVSVAFQEWIVDEVMAVIAKEGDFRAQAMILPTGFMESISVELFTDESDSRAVSTRNFETLEEAKDWIRKLERMEKEKIRNSSNKR